MKSMTGFGESTQVNGHYSVTVEIKSVNHRFLDIQIRSPKQVNAYETQIRQIIKDTLPRGRVEVFVTIKETSDEGKKVAIHWGLIDQLVTQLQVGAAKYGATDLPVSQIIQQVVTLPDFVEITEQGQTDESLAGLLLAAVTEACGQNAASRLIEGAGLEAVMVANRQVIGAALTQLSEFVTVYETEFSARFQQKLQDYLGSSVDQERLLTEMALLLERGDIHEELDRLAIHLKKFDQLVTKEEPVGRELDFLIQEMNREINTIGSKSGAIEIKELVVQMKTTVEKIREQVQNVE
ncbi:YicC/YloC family endoribonuclease [Enterococcus diestrammenae]|uniref:YicC/YloC family endoribonuclease n=1 Tax=Enterococcus TaxID=1350 RepID=UPI00137A95B8|nr:YicC/YloC family endoribonuclease [Enterococcus diestrammenae]KAF1297442.1 YicC family protein [Enterococcus diestrammenae]